MMVDMNISRTQIIRPLTLVPALAALLALSACGSSVSDADAKTARAAAVEATGGGKAGDVEAADADEAYAYDVEVTMPDGGTVDVAVGADGKALPLDNDEVVGEERAAVVKAARAKVGDHQVTSLERGDAEDGYAYEVELDTGLFSSATVLLDSNQKVIRATE